MKHDLVDHLACPDCHTDLTLRVIDEEDGQVKEGELRCETGHAFPIQDFVPRFVSAEDYASKFSRQRLYVRRHFRHYENDTSGYRLFERTTGITDEMVKTGISLEVGCGYGRFLDVVQSRGGRIVGVELSTHSVDLAQDYVGRRPGVDIVQADLFRLPFKLATFDRVFSVGVLHHTPDTKKAFDAIVPFARPGGLVSVWVYHPQEKIGSNRWRRFTTSMDHRWLYALCILNQLAFSWIRALPGGWRFDAIVPGAIPVKGDSFWLRVMSDFDNLSPVYAHVHSSEEVVSWFSGAGLREVAVLDRQTAVQGRRPAAALKAFGTGGRVLAAVPGLQ